jgi:hypothetical protein
VTVWLVFTGSNRDLGAAHYVHAVTTDRESARRIMVAVMRERERWAGPVYPFEWRPDPGATRRGHAGWGFEGGGNKVRIEEWPVTAPGPL